MATASPLLQVMIDAVRKAGRGRGPLVVHALALQRADELEEALARSAELHLLNKVEVRIIAVGGGWVAR